LEHITKRELLGEIARTYDPCGWLAPLIVVAKVLMPRLWQTVTEWDDPVLKELLEHWIAHRTSDKHLHQFEIPRHVGNILDNQQGCILHGQNVPMRQLSTSSQIILGIYWYKKLVSPY